MLVRFDELPRSVRERFAAIAAAPNQQAIDFEPKTRWGRVLDIVLVVAALAIEEITRRAPHGYQHVDRESMQGYTIAAALFGIAVVGFVVRSRWPGPPYRLGRYLFPSYMVDARKDSLELTPTPQMGRPTVVTRTRAGSVVGHYVTFSGTREFFWNRGDAFASRFLGARDQFESAMQRRDLQSLQAVDPFWECTSSGQWTAAPGTPSEGPVCKNAPAAMPFVRLGVGAALGFAAFATAGLREQSWREQSRERSRAYEAAAAQRRQQDVQAARTRFTPIAASPAADAWLAALLSSLPRYGTAHIAVTLVPPPDAELLALSAADTPAAPRRPASPTTMRFGGPDRGPWVREESRLDIERSLDNVFAPLGHPENATTNWVLFGRASTYSYSSTARTEPEATLTVREHVDPPIRVVHLARGRSCPIVNIRFEAAVEGAGLPVLTTTTAAPALTPEEEARWLPQWEMPVGSCVLDQISRAHRTLTTGLRGMFVRG